MTTSDQVTDTTLVRRAREGDQDAFRALFRRHTAELRSRIRSLISPAILRKVSLQDVLQEACLVAARRIHEFEDRGEGSFARWLGKIGELRARKIVEQYAGTAKRQISREVSRGDRPDTRQFLGQGPSPSEVAMAGELHEAAGRALRRLSPDYREVLRLVQEEDRPFSEVALRMGRSPDAVRMLYGRALDRFAELLDTERGASA